AVAVFGIIDQADAIYFAGAADYSGIINPALTRLLLAVMCALNVAERYFIALSREDEIDRKYKLQHFEPFSPIDSHLHIDLIELMIHAEILDHDGAFEFAGHANNRFHRPMLDALDARRVEFARHFIEMEYIVA